MTNPTPSESSLTALADACEKASGPDRELDARIDALFNKRPLNGDFDACECALWRVKEPWHGLLVRSDGYARGSFCVASYTAHLDAAMRLVPEPAINSWTLGQNVHHRHWQASVNALDAEGSPMSIGFGSSDHAPALALAAAALRALASNSGGEG